MHKSGEINHTRQVTVSILVSLGIHIRWRRSNSLICISASNVRAEAWLREVANFKQTENSVGIVSRLADFSVRDGVRFLVEAEL